MLVCIVCAKNQQCALESTISFGKTRKYSNEKGKRIDQSAAFWGVSFKVILGSFKGATSGHKEEERRKKRYMGGHFCCFICFVCFTYVLVGGTRLLSFS